MLHPFLTAERKGGRQLHDKCGVDVGCFIASPSSLAAEGKRERLLDDKCGIDVGCFTAFPMS